MMQLVFKEMKAINLIIVLALFGSSSTWAQSQSTFKRTTATILFASIGGGVLGLSTLSFYGKPQEHTDNITTGVLLGFVLGLTYVVYDQYGVQALAAPPLNTTQKQMSVAILDSKKRDPYVNWPLFSFELNW